MAGASQYDAIAEQYRRSKSSPLRTYVESFTFLNLVGDVAGLHVLDLACGEGFYSRALKRRGAERVVGVDQSAGMIRLAERQEAADPLGVEYLCRDARDLGDLGRFDVVVAAYLLHYAPDTDDLLRMGRGIRRHLPAGGRFVTLNENPDPPAAGRAAYEQYGFSKTVEEPRRDGSRITYYMVAGRELFEFHAFHFARATYERVLDSAGFERIAWHPLQLDPAGAAEYGAGYWRAYLDDPPVVGLECRVRAE